MSQSKRMVEVPLASGEHLVNMRTSRILIGIGPPTKAGKNLPRKEWKRLCLLFGGKKLWKALKERNYFDENGIK